ncbi:MAG: hypothetical protein PHE59_01985 [Patescibacteria group bacterium]|nr:hypothetical protein [Patescibacteria group bacterium]MDD5164606.1 hypothetical protein [Patescibacteria group bacterium]MDD5534552.1 hypothetical protein [Patescibacteria group bacterium]
METRKIALACFIGGALCCAVALFAAPMYWWLGLLAGFAGGYLSYEFRGVCKAAPVALRIATKESRKIYQSEIVRTKEWFSKNHPFAYLNIILAVIFGLYLIPYDWIIADTYPNISHYMRALITYFSIQALAVFGAPFLFSFWGARFVDKCYWISKGEDAYLKEANNPDIWRYKLKQKPLTYLNVLRWMVLGAGFFIWTPCKFCLKIVWTILCFLGRFAWHLFRLIHSNKRVLCAIDGTLGGLISYFYFISMPMPFGSKIMFIIFGGLLGGVFGIISYEIISKRILHLNAATT